MDCEGLNNSSNKKKKAVTTKIILPMLSTLILSVINAVSHTFSFSASRQRLIFICCIAVTIVPLILFVGRPFSLNLSRNLSQKLNLTKVLVVARWKEDVSWLELYLSHLEHRVYAKANPLAAHNVPVNKGNEASSYLLYIVENYDRLPDVSIFVHGGYPDPHQKMPNDLVQAINALQWGKYPYMPMQTGIKIKLHFDAQSSDLQTRWNYDFWMKTCFVELGQMYPPSTTECYCCASFALTRQAIHSHSKAFYEQLYAHVMNASEPIFGLTGGMLECTWHILFGQPPITRSFPMCDLFYCQSNSSSTTLRDCTRKLCP